MIKKLIPAFFKPLIRFIYYKEQRAKVFRERKIKKQQNELIKQCNSTAEKLVVFLIMGTDWETGIDKISGGTISIVSLCEESKKLKEVHNAEVIMCTFPNEHLLLHHTQFKNNTAVFRFEQLKEYFKTVNNILIHIPEFLTPYFLENISNSDKAWLKKMMKLNINIMNQNIQLMPENKYIDELKKFASEVTISTAHQQYCNEYYRDKYNVPLHKFSVWISPEKYFFIPYAAKENLIVVSPDDHPMKDLIINKLNLISGLKIQVIQRLTYEEYKKTISKAKWAITFGEGLDGYILEPIFSGCVAFAVYNEDFFTEDFKNTSGIYNSYEELQANIADDIKKIDNPIDYKKFQKKQFDLFAKHYNYKDYQNNIKLFFEEKYTYP